MADARRVGYRHDTAIIDAIHHALVDAGISFATYLPDSLNYPLVRALEADPSIQCVEQGPTPVTSVAVGSATTLRLIDTSGPQHSATTRGGLNAQPA